MVVVGHEEAGAGQAGVVVALAVVGGPDRHVVGLALHDDQRVLTGRFVLRRAPDNVVGPRVPGAASCHLHLLGDLTDLEAVFVDQDEQELLAHALFRRFLEPLLAHVAEDLAVPHLDLKLGFVGC